VSNPTTQPTQIPQSPRMDNANNAINAIRLFLSTRTREKNAQRKKASTVQNKIRVIALIALFPLSVAMAIRATTRLGNGPRLTGS